MTRQRRPIRVAGEPVTALLPGLFALYDSIVVHDDGMASMYACLPAEGHQNASAPARRPPGPRREHAAGRHAEAHQVMLSCVPRQLVGGGVRTTVSLDDDLLAEAQRLTGTTEKSALLRAALTALIERESARRLARLGGSEPQLQPIARRRPATG